MLFLARLSFCLVPTLIRNLSSSMILVVVLRISSKLRSENGSESDFISAFCSDAEHDLFCRNTDCGIEFELDLDCDSEFEFDSAFSSGSNSELELDADIDFDVEFHFNSGFGGGFENAIVNGI